MRNTDTVSGDSTFHLLGIIYISYNFIVSTKVSRLFARYLVVTMSSNLINYVTRQNKAIALDFLKQLRESKKEEEGGGSGSGDGGCVADKVVFKKKTKPLEEKKVIFSILV